MSEPLVIEVCIQRSGDDCGVAALAMITGKSYAQVREVIPKRAKVDTEGMSNRQIATAARKLGCPVKFIKDGDLSNAVGIVDLERYCDPTNPRAGYEGHWAVIARGVLIDPANGMIWTDIDSFFTTLRWVPLGIYVRTGEDSNGSRGQEGIHVGGDEQ